MVAKMRIIDEPGQDALLLPEQVNRALAANDRVEYYITLLQAAEQHAREPGAPFSDRGNERRAGGVDDAALDQVVARSHGDGNGACHVPRTADIHGAIEQGVTEMLLPRRADADAAALNDGIADAPPAAVARRREQETAARAPCRPSRPRCAPRRAARPAGRRATGPAR